MFFESAISEGYKSIDLNGEPSIGIGNMQMTIRNGLRCSAARAFLEPVQNRRNLHILTHSLVTRINFDIHNRAVGVNFERNNITYSVKASKEVIVSAGVINSPQLLMLSGIGHRKHLEDMGIDVIADVPVGDNFREHVLTSIDFLIDSYSLPKDSDDLTIKNLAQLLINGPDH